MKIDFEIFKSEDGTITTEIGFPTKFGVFWVPYRIIKDLPEKIEFMKEYAAASNQYSERQPRFGFSGDDEKPKQTQSPEYMGEVVGDA